MMMMALTSINKSHMPYSDSQPVALMRNGTDIKFNVTVREPFLVVVLYTPYVQYCMLYCTR